MKLLLAMLLLLTSSCVTRTVKTDRDEEISVEAGIRIKRNIHFSRSNTNAVPDGQKTH